MAISIDEAVPGPATDDAPPERRRGGRGRMVVEVLLLTALAVAMLFPVLWMLETSIKENRDVYAVPAKFFGFDSTLNHFKDVFVASDGGRWTCPSRSSTPSWWPGRRPCWPPCSGCRRPGPSRASL